MCRSLRGSRGVARWLVLVAACGAFAGGLSCHESEAMPKAGEEEDARPNKDRCQGKPSDSAGGDGSYERCLLAEAKKAYGVDDEDVSINARRILESLLGTSVKVDAFLWLSFLERQAEHYEQALRRADQLIELARKSGGRFDLGRGLTAGAQALHDDGRFVESFRYAEEAVSLLQKLPVRSIGPAKQGSDAMKYAEALANALMAKGDAFRRSGVMKQACEPLRAAAAISEIGNCRRARAKAKMAMCEEESGDNDEAKKWLEAARGEECDEPDVIGYIELNSALQDIFDGELDRAEKKIDIAVSEVGVDSDAKFLRAYIWVARGRLKEAAALLDEAAQKPSDRDWPWKIYTDSADLAQRQGNPALAEQLYRLAIGEVRSLRSDSRSRSAHLMLSHQAPYEGLVSLLASQERWLEALLIIQEFDASDMLRTAANPAQDGTVVDALAPLQSLLESLRARDVVVLFVPSERMLWKDDYAYRFRILQGEVRGERIGTAQEVRGMIAALLDAPNNPTPAQELGQKLLPRAASLQDLYALPLVRRMIAASLDTSSNPTPASAQRLYVLPLGVVSRVPLALLRQSDGSLAQSNRPMSILPALQTVRPPAESTNGTIVVIGSPGDDLPAAEQEGKAIAELARSRFPGQTVRLSGGGTSRSATVEELLKEPRPFILHVAAHVRSDGLWPALELADGKKIEAPDLLRHGLAPEIAVLANCGSAADAADERWGSPAIALSEAGTKFVIATRQSVPDEPAAALMKALHEREEWPADPVTALAKVQVAAASGELKTDKGKRIDETAWAAFLVIERPVYVPPGKTN